MDILCTMIVPAALAPIARPMAAGLSPGFADNMFTRGLGPVGGTDTTHYISTGYISDRFVPIMTDAALMYGACQQMSLSYTQAQCEELVAACVVRLGGHEPVLEELVLELRPE